MTDAAPKRVVQRGLWFDEFEIGVVYEHRPGRTITEADNVLFTTLTMNTQDGYGTGTLANFGVGTDGIITGAFSNGLTRQLGQVALATFTNPEGLVSGTNNLYYVAANSGHALITTPETLNAGRILGGALELSNVDLTHEFIGLITASTGFSASGRVISTSNELLNELMLIAQ